MYFLYIFLALVASVAAIVMYRLNTKIDKPKPSDFFPWKGIATDIIKKAQKNPDTKDKLTDEDILMLKNLFDNTAEKFFKLLNKKTEKLTKFEDGQFEKILQKVSKKINEHYMEKNKIDPNDSKDVKALKERRNKLIFGFMMAIAFGNYLVGGGPAGPNLYATYDKYKEELKPMLDIFYKGPAFPTGPPAEMGMKPVSPPMGMARAVVMEPSEYFPYVGFIDNLLNPILIKNERGFFQIDEEQKNVFKLFYNFHVKKMFKYMNKETKNLRSFNPTQFEKILQSVIRKINDDLMKRIKDPRFKDETKLIQQIMPQLFRKILGSKRMVRRNYGGMIGFATDFYATYRKEMSNLQPLLRAFYKGPPIPQSGPPIKTCKKDEKLKNERCVKIMCPNGGTMTGKHRIGQTECKISRNNGLGGIATSIQYYNNISLPERVSRPTSRSPSPTCKKDEKLKNGRCVKIMCPSGGTMTGNHWNGQTECRISQERRGRTTTSFQYYNNNFLPERVSTPTSRSPSPTCKKDEKLKNGRCVKIMCPSGGTMTGNHFSGHTECKTLYQRKGRTFSSFQWLNNNSLPERVSTPTSRSPSPPTSRSPSPPTSRPSSPICAQNETLKNGKCVRVSCPLGYKHTGQILKRGKTFMHSCVNTKTGMAELIPNEALPEAKCIQYTSRGTCAIWGPSKGSLRVSSPGPTRTPTPSPTRKPNPVKECRPKDKILGTTVGGIRRYTKDECNTLNGTWYRNGECIKKTGDSYSSLCKNEPVKPKSTTPTALVCQPAASLGLPKCKDYKLSRGIFPACGERVNVYGKPNFVELNFSIPIGEWRSIDQIRKIPGNSGYTIHGGDGNVSFVFPENCKLRLTINNGPNFSGPVTFVFTKSCPNSIRSGACGQIKFDRRWTYAQSIRLERI